MGTVVRAYCECSFCCELVTGLTREGMYEPAFCPTCNTYISRAQFDCAPQATYRCEHCGSRVAPVTLHDASCPWCRRSGLFFRPIRAVV